MGGHFGRKRCCTVAQWVYRGVNHSLKISGNPYEKCRVWYEFFYLQTCTKKTKPFTAKALSQGGNVGMPQQSAMRTKKVNDNENYEFSSKLLADTFNQLFVTGTKKRRQKNWCENFTSSPNRRHEVVDHFTQRVVQHLWLKSTSGMTDFILRTRSTFLRCVFGMSSMCTHRARNVLSLFFIFCWAVVWIL